MRLHMRRVVTAGLLLLSGAVVAGQNPFVPPPVTEKPAQPVPPPDPMLEEEARRRKLQEEAERKKREEEARKAKLAAEKKLFEQLTYVGRINQRYIYRDQKGQCYVYFQGAPRSGNLVHDGCGHHVWLRTNAK